MSNMAEGRMIPVETAATGKIITRWYLGVLIAAGVLYITTCASGIGWQDSGLFVYRIWHNDLAGDLGIAVAHPLYVLMGMAVKQIPFGDLAYKVNLMTAVLGAAAIANLFLLLRLWLGKTIPALIGAASLAVSWTFWGQAAIAEDYTLLAALFFGELICLLQFVRTRKVGYLYVLSLLNGLAISNHISDIFGTACYVVLVFIALRRRQVRPAQLAVMALLWAAGAMAFEYLLVKNLVQTGSLGGTFKSAFFGKSWSDEVLNTTISAKMAVENVIFILLNFPTPVFLLFFVGLFFLWKRAPGRSFANIIAVLTAAYFVFAFRYTVPDRHVFFLPFYCLAAVVIGLGADCLLARFNHRFVIAVLACFTLLPVPVYFFTPVMGRSFYKSLGQRRQLPYRDDYKYFLQPWKTGYNGAEQFAREALEGAEKDAIIYADSTTVHALLYLQEVKGLRPDVKLVSLYDHSSDAPVLNENTVGDLMRNQGLYVVSPLKTYCPKFLLENYDFAKDGILYRVVDRQRAETGGKNQ